MHFPAEFSFPFSLQGANATAAAYQAARSCGLALDPSVVSAIISGLTRGEGGSVERAVAASEAFVAQGVKMSPRAFATIAVAAASQGNVEARTRNPERPTLQVPTSLCLLRPFRLCLPRLHVQ